MHDERARTTRRDVANLLGGLGLLILGFAGIQYATDSIDGWRDAVSVCLTYFLLMPAASRLFWNGMTSLAVARKLLRHTAARDETAQSTVGSRPSYCRNLLIERNKDGLDCGRVGLEHTSPLVERRPYQPFDKLALGDVVAHRIVD